MEVPLLDAQAQETTLATLLAEETPEGNLTLLVFVRHFGCIGCSVQMASLAPRFPVLREHGVRILVIGLGPTSEIKPFRERYQLDSWDIPVLTEPTGQLQQALGLVRSFWGAWGLRGAWDFVLALFRGHMQHSLRGDTLQQGGALLLDEALQVRYFFAGKSLTDHAPTNDIIEAVLAHQASRIPTGQGC